MIDGVGKSGPAGRIDLVRTSVERSAASAKAGDGLGGELPGMGPPGEEVWAFADEAVVFVEVAYDYQSLVGATFGISSEVTATASFTVRDDRDLSQIYQRDPADPEPIARCSVFGDAESLRS